MWVVDTRFLVAMLTSPGRFGDADEYKKKIIQEIGVYRRQEGSEKTMTLETTHYI